MKIAIISDTHFGYARFEEDSFTQAKGAFTDASATADLIIHAGDIFDTKNPKLETINRAMEIMKNAKVPIFAIHGNHERRSKDLVNPAQLLATTEFIKLIHGGAETFEKNNERVQVFGLGNVPEEFAELALRKSLETFVPDAGAFKILVLHQSIKELMANGEEEISLEYLETLPFDLIINAHIHQRVTKLNGRFIIPGSTVVTQLKKDETAPRGYMLYDTKTKTSEFKEIECRKFFFEEMKFEDANALDVRNAVQERINGLRKGNENALIRVKITGTLREGLEAENISMVADEFTYIDNEMNSNSVAEKIRKIRDIKENKLSVTEAALRQLEEKIRGKITLFNPFELFEKLLIDNDAAMEYLKSQEKT